MTEPTILQRHRGAALRLCKKPSCFDCVDELAAELASSEARLIAMLAEPDIRDAIEAAIITKSIEIMRSETLAEMGSVLTQYADAAFAAVADALKEE